MSSLPRGSRASDKYCRDLTRRAADGELDPVFCREKELDRDGRTGIVGGLLYHGIPDRSFAVTLQPFHGWQIHT